MTGNYGLSPRAKRDVYEIWEYTAERWGIDQAEIYIRQMWQNIDAVANKPTVGQKCSEVREGYYKFPSGAHFIFYKVIEGGVDVVRILHERMNFEAHFDPSKVG